MLPVPLVRRPTPPSHSFCCAPPHPTPPHPTPPHPHQQDMAGFNPEECMRKDYKQWWNESAALRYGVATVPLAPGAFAALCPAAVHAEGGLAGEIAAAAAARDVGLFGVMLAYVDADTGEFRRGLMVHSADPVLLEKAVAHLLASTLDLSEVALGGDAGGSGEEGKKAGGSEGGSGGGSSGGGSRGGEHVGGPLLRLFEQRNVRASRKVVQPILHEFFSAL